MLSLFSLKSVGGGGEGRKKSLAFNQFWTFESFQIEVVTQTVCRYNVQNDDKCAKSTLLTVSELF